MLAYYTSLLKKEQILSRVSEEGRLIADVANDLACSLKEFSVSCEVRDLERAQELARQSEEISKTLVAMVSNLKGNYDSYLASLLPDSQDKKKEEAKSETPLADSNQLTTLLETVKSLKEMKDSLVR